MMQITERHTSPDGLLTFIVCRIDGDTHLYFDDYPWHTHADLLAGFSGLSEEAAVQRFVDDLIENRLVIAVHRVGNEIRDVAVVFEPYDDPYKPDDETIELRDWSGRRCEAR